MAEKYISVKLPGAEKGEFKDLQILPGTTPEDILQDLGFGDGYELAVPDAQAFDRGSNLYQQVSDGEKLFVVRASDVGISPLQPFFILTTPYLLLIALILTALVTSLIRRRGSKGKTRSSHRPKRSAAKKAPIVIGPKKSPRRVQGPSSQKKVRKLTSKANPGGGVVKRSSDPQWKEKGWKKVGGKLVGYYKTPFGKFSGSIKTKLVGDPEFYIKNPPPELKHHEHASCFSQHVGGGWLKVHFVKNPGEPNSGITRIEQILREAQEKARGGMWYV